MGKEALVIVARYRVRKKKPSEAPVPVLRTAKEITSHPSMVLKAVAGSGGSVRLIAERLGCSRHVANRVLSDQNLYANESTFYEVRRAFQAEEEVLADKAEETLLECLEQRIDLKTAASVAKFVLERRRADKGWGNVTKHEVSGTVNHGVLHVDAKVLDLPLEMRKAFLDALERHESEVLETEGCEISE